MTPQTYELTAFSTCVVLIVAFIFLWLLAKLILNVVQLIIGPKASKGQRLDKSVGTEEKTEKDNDGDDNGEEQKEELPDLETKKES